MRILVVEPTKDPYETWNQIRDELNECYSPCTPREHLPLSQQKEFRRIKNDIIREAENIRLGLPTFEDEKMRDEPEETQEEHPTSGTWEQAQRCRAAQSVLQDVYALDEEHAEAAGELERLWAEGYDKFDIAHGDTLVSPQHWDDQPFELIVSNPPYLTAEEMRHLQPEVAQEPAMALEAGEDGLVFYRALAEHYQNALRPGGALVLEIGWQQRQAVAALLAANGWADIECRKDFGGNDRCMIAHRPEK